MDDRLFESGWSYIALGLLALLASRWKGTRARRRVATVRGEVTGVDVDDGTRHVNIRFYLYGENVARSFTTTHKCTIGDRIDVIYDPAHPKNAGIKGMPETDARWWMVLVGVGIVIEAHRIWLRYQ